MRGSDWAFLKWDGLIQLDPVDDTLFEGLRKLMTWETENSDKIVKDWLTRPVSPSSLGQVLLYLFHIIAYNWSVFLNEAEQHLQHIVRRL